MAIDTDQKRRSALTVSLYANPPSVPPDGTIGPLDRQQAGYGYVGISAAAAAAFQAAWARYVNVLLDGTGVR
jgi:hypothetical protein